MKLTYLGDFEIISFYDLPKNHQEEIKDDYDSITESSFLYHFAEDEIFDLNNFIKTPDEIFDGIFGTSYFSGYGLKLNSSCDGAKLWYIRN